MTQELRVRVAKAIHNVWREQNSREDDLANYATWDEIEAWERTQILYEADAAIAIIRAETLEEAARVADAAAMVHGSGYSIDDLREIAAAIRALKEKP